MGLKSQQGHVHTTECLSLTLRCITCMLAGVKMRHSIMHAATINAHTHTTASPG